MSATIPAAPARRPPIGKVAFYIAAQKKKEAGTAKEKRNVKKKDDGIGGTAAPKKITMKQAAADKRKAKKAKDAEEVEVAVAVVASRSAKKAAGIGEEEARGADARAQAIAQLAEEQKDGGINWRSRTEGTWKAEDVSAFVDVGKGEEIEEDDPTRRGHE
jgi:hypothetical protein